MSKEELEKAAELGYTAGNLCLVPFLNGVDFGRQASRTPAVSVEGENAAEEYITGWNLDELEKEEIRSHFLAGFQARAHLVELLREARDWLQHGRDRTAAMDALIARIDAALKGEA